jgi:HNH endonuclease
MHQYGRLIVGMITRDGYRVIKLRENRRYAHKGVHVLVLMAFVGPRPSEKHEGCHNDGNPGNDRLDNLRWDTASGNQSDRRKHGTARYAPTKLTKEVVSLIRTSPEVSDKVWMQRLRVSYATIASARLKLTWKDVPEQPLNRRSQSTSGAAK